MAIKVRPTGITASVATPLWVSDEQWPELVHPFASAIDTELPEAPSSVHLLLRDKASWVELQVGADDDCFRGLSQFVDRGLAQKTRAVDQVIFSNLQLRQAIPVFEVPQCAVPAAEC